MIAFTCALSGVFFHLSAIWYNRLRAANVDEHNFNLIVCYIKRKKKAEQKNEERKNTINSTPSTQMDIQMVDHQTDIQFATLSLHN